MYDAAVARTDDLFATDVPVVLDWLCRLAVDSPSPTTSKALISIRTVLQSPKLVPHVVSIAPFYCGSSSPACGFGSLGCS
jgi:hypothetical protein